MNDLNLSEVDTTYAKQVRIYLTMTVNYCSSTKQVGPIKMTNARASGSILPYI